MADIKISELPVASSVSDSDIVVINQGGTTKTAARSLVKNPGTVTFIQAGTGLSGGLINGSGTIALLTAGASQLGGIKVGTGLSIDGNGVLSTNAVASSYAVSMPGSGNWLTGAPTITIGTGDYTIEMFVNISAYDPTGADMAVFFDARGPGSNSTAGPLFYVSPEQGHLRLYSDGVIVAEGTQALPIPTSGWHHVAAVRESGAVTLYIDGASVASGTDSTNWTSGQLYINALEADTTLNANMRVSGLRISSTARYSGPTYTVPTAAFEPDASSVYILLQSATLDTLFTSHGSTPIVSGPFAGVEYVPLTRTVTAGAGLSGGGDLSADRTFAVAYGTTAGTAAEGNDSRLSDARTPTAHKSTHAIGGTDVLAPSDIGAATPASVQVFTSSGTWTKPANAIQVIIELVSGGNGGGAGGKGTAGTAIYGGSGGGAGGYSRTALNASDLEATCAVTVGAGGTGSIYGGAAATVGGASGFANTSTPTLFLARAQSGGTAGQNGGTTAPTTGTGGAPNSNAGGTANVTGTGGAGSGSANAPTGGGAGGGVSAASQAFNGGNGATNPFINTFSSGGGGSSVANGSNAVSATTRSAGSLIMNGGGGGGGGASSFATGSGGNGASGSGYGSGGGGGGATVGSGNGGNGGAGANGIVVVTTYF